MATKNKSKAHAEKMIRKRIDNERARMCKETVQLIMPDIYLILAEVHGFRDEELKAFNARLYDHVKAYKGTDCRAGVSIKDVIEILTEKYGISEETCRGLFSEPKEKI